MSDLISIELNGVTYRVEASHTMASFLEHHGINTQGGAIAISNQIIPRSEWQKRGLSQGESISLFQAIAGG
ncbi:MULTISPECIES: sulfur carrier protein ThiS [Aliivibrio]|uniref:Sulfur carrier protein ThiS n=1 Tax=Aliivibrio finisterrensis TaxID=511998 RepID=A0A4Q5KV36_9GAMM|nr:MULTISPECIES: sulfur carrier protein ThiS [Aliivibrio]MDD9179557.1 sulfur carrier protein ThiS [Aliivibrio sp. A6]RYU50659.1 sulfur carrier protein ThiS [Aliivibrio finisterrensis]RYU51444.1 sulfur carrier protein ThiS [Aliivibrio finisterrensis]RYU54515.1 sulfur carrier protein ThiS [Aliivibrio finisterrensis]RYU63700.1 sulfur carrier protein ThiS [Aliivibrio finisterrensis]